MTESLGGVPKFIPSQIPEKGKFDTAPVSEENNPVTAKTSIIAGETMKSISEIDKEKAEITSTITKKSSEQNIIPQNPLIETAQAEATEKNQKDSSISQLMSLTEKQWEDRDVGLLNSKMEQFCKLCVPEGEPPQTAGFLEKHDLEPGSDVAVIGDIHGNDLRLDLTLKALQKRGFLDDQFHCLPGKRLVFLGDYVDRGKNSLKVLELLITLNLENKGQVHLIRGNHEDRETHKGRLERYADKDPKYLNYMQNPNNLPLVDRFYKSLPVAVYLGQKAADSDKREYIQYCHGLFHLYTDPFPLLEDENPHAHLWVNGSRGFSERICNMPDENKNEKLTVTKQREAMKKLKKLERKIPITFADIYWLDVGTEFKIKRNSGRYELSPETIKAYLQVSSTEKAKIKQIIRGHQLGGIWTVRGQDLVGKKGKDLVTTLDPSAEDGQQIFLEIKLADKVENYTQTCVTLPMDPNHDKALEKIRGSTLSK